MRGPSGDDGHHHDHHHDHHGHDPGGQGDDGRPLNPWLESRLRRLGSDGQVLDLGCGRGYWLAWMRAEGMSPVGVEPDPRVRAGAAHAPVVVGDGARIPLRDSSVGLVWCIHVLHHLSDPAQVLSEVVRVLRPGGHLLLAETVEDHPLISLGRRVWPSWDGVPIQSRFRAAALLELLGTAGLEVVEHRQHSLMSFAAWALPRGGRRAWRVLTKVEEALPAQLARFGAHLECVARRS